MPLPDAETASLRLSMFGNRINPVQMGDPCMDSIEAQTENADLYTVYSHVDTIANVRGFGVPRR